MASGDAKITLEGMDELIKALYEIGERIAIRAENKALREGAEILRAEASSRAPRRTGYLAGNIEKSGVQTASDGTKHINVGPAKTAFYGEFLEWGTSKMKAQPFLGPAMEEKRNEIFGAMARVLRDEIEKETRKRQ